MPPGVSFAEKRNRIQNIFHESGEFYQLKDIEVLGPKRGVGGHAIKEVVQSLVDDNLVVCDKIAQSTYYWSYPSTAIQPKKNTLANLTTKYDKEVKRREQLEKQIEEFKATLEDSEELELLSKELEKQEETNKSLNAELAKYKEVDPEIFKLKQTAIALSKDAINRCAENIWQMKSYCVNKFHMDSQLFDNTFHLTENDYETL